MKDKFRVAIEVRNIVKKFGAFAALDKVDLKVANGELLALLGPSGSGKTTLLRIIAGLDWPDRGAVSFDGEDALAHGASERHVGFVFQHYALFRHMTVFENVAFGLRVQPRAVRKSEAGIRARVKELLDLVQLDWMAGRYPSQLSGGQRQRIAVAPGLAIEPPTPPPARSGASSSSTSHSARWMPRCARNCGSGCAPCTRRSTSPRSSSPMTRRK